MVGAVRQQFGTLVRLMLTVILAVGMMMSSHARMQSDDLAEIAQVAADDQSEIADHGHGHDVADHDHNTAFLPTRMALGMIASNRADWVLADSALPDRRAFDLHRPPRA